MKTLVLHCQKGGVGKSSITFNLAVAAHQAGEKVVLVDLDPQRSLTAMHEARQTDDLVIRPMTVADWPSWIGEAQRALPKAFVFVDTPGYDHDELDPVLAQANLCLIPLLPSAIDMRAAVATVRRMHAVQRRFAFILNGVNMASVGRTADAIAALRHSGIVAPPLGQRVVFKDATISGLGVSEFEPASKAATEIRDLWRWVATHCEEDQDGQA